MPFALQGIIIVPPDSIPTPDGISRIGANHEQTTPRLEHIQEWQAIVECIRQRREQTLFRITEVFQSQKRRQPVTAATEQRSGTEATLGGRCRSHAIERPLR